MLAVRSRGSFVRLVDWRTVLAAGAPVWVLIGGLVAWQKLAPKPAVMAKSIPTTGTSPPAFTRPAEQLPVPRTIPDENPFNTRTTTAKAPEPKPVEIDPEVAEGVGKAARELFRGLLVTRPEPVNVGGAGQKPVPAGCKTFDTALHFVKNYDEAKKQATRQGKLVFALHLSGNIEDDGFT